MGFREWLLLVERSLVDPAVLDSYERAFQNGLEALIQRTQDPELRRTFEGMRRCPVQGRDGRCSRFVDYVLGALLRNGCHHQYDVEDALQRIVFRMLSPVGESGRQRKTIFDFDEDRPFDLRLGNPIEVLFKVYLANEIRNILGGRIPALRTRQKTGTLSIGYGTDTGEVSPDEIPDRMPSGEQEMLRDIMELLRRRSTPEMPLADLFMSILRGEGTQAQRSRFGHAKADMMRKTIVGVIEQYAQRTQNWHLLRLLDRFRGFDATRPDPARQQSRPPKPPKSVYPPDEQDYRSIVDVLEKHDRSVSMMVLGKVRRRWLERPPRDPASVHRNRLADVLARMVEDGVLAKQGARYVPGAAYGRYLGTPEPLGVG
jgi:hypothetical protein